MDPRSGDRLWGDDDEPGRPFAPSGAPSPRYTAPRHPGGPSGDLVAARPELVLAGWWRRAVAATIDAVIIAIVAVAVLVALGLGFFSADSEAEALAIGALSLVAFAVVVVVTLAYAPVMMWRTNGRTVGRMVAGTRVVRADGRPMSLGVATIREVVLKAGVFGLLSQATFGLAGLADVLWPLIDRENRALHDFGVDTRTVLN